MNFKHGMMGTAIYATWASMVRRCHCESDVAYPNYGGRGILVCDAWRDFRNFYRDIGSSRPKGGMIERIDNNKGYSPENCRWATRAEQNVNKRNNVLITLDGETHALSVWAARFGLKYTTVHQRIWKYGWSPEEALKLPLTTSRKGIPRGQRIAMFGANHGVQFNETEVAA